MRLLRAPRYRTRLVTSRRSAVGLHAVVVHRLPVVEAFGIPAEEDFDAVAGPLGELRRGRRPPRSQVDRAGCRRARRSPRYAPAITSCRPRPTARTARSAWRATRRTARTCSPRTSEAGEPTAPRRCPRRTARLSPPLLRAVRLQHARQRRREQRGAGRPVGPAERPRATGLRHADRHRRRLQRTAPTPRLIVRRPGRRGGRTGSDHGGPGGGLHNGDRRGPPRLPAGARGGGGRHAHRQRQGHRRPSRADADHRWTGRLARLRTAAEAVFGLEARSLKLPHQRVAAAPARVRLLSDQAQGRSLPSERGDRKPSGTSTRLSRAMEARGSGIRTHTAGPVPRTPPNRRRRLLRCHATGLVSGSVG